METKNEIAEALSRADWSNTCIGNKVLIQAAISALCPDTLIAKLRERHIEAASSAEAARNESDAMYWGAYQEALSDVIQEITGDKPESP